ncbi:reverse transcriptase/maturase family protein [Salinarimonas ramus]|uniref:reverse transcriptase/maturase family protein n=1 Tax=Salinarimonas ramus TaxID=690164 RepID=UPI0016697FD6|nr:reverse transcriptase/maturase family protein [Salinarimonas ramus]
MSKDEATNMACVRGASGSKPGPRARVSPSDTAKTMAWFKPRAYKHFDVPVGSSFAHKATKPNFVAAHSFSPLIRYNKRTKRYKPQNHATVFKDRAIMYASHRDACILSYYSHMLSEALERTYEEFGLSDCVIAYRRLSKANYHFADDALRFAKAHMPCRILAFDVTGFFDSLDHGLLKERLKRVLEHEELSLDWYRVFSSVTNYRYVHRSDLVLVESFASRLRSPSREPIATLRELKAEGVEIHKQGDRFGIPQGTPISSTLANLYMIDFDLRMNSFCAKRGAYYRRYSDDILIICSFEAADEIEEEVLKAIHAEKLEMRADKTERTSFEIDMKGAAQYLGFDLRPDGALLRASSLARQWRKMKRVTRRIERVGRSAIQNGTAEKIFTRKLRKRFTHQGRVNRSFPAYARRAAATLHSRKILEQIRRLERQVEYIIRGFED